MNDEDAVEMSEDASQMFENWQDTVSPYPRQISEEQLRKSVGYVSEIFSALGLDLHTQATAQTSRHFLRALYDSPEGYEGDPKVLTAVCRVQASDLILAKVGPRLLWCKMVPGYETRSGRRVIATGNPGRERQEQLIQTSLSHKVSRQPVCGTLIGVKRAGSHLFLRDAFAGGA